MRGVIHRMTPRIVDLCALRGLHPWSEDPMEKSNGRSGERGKELAQGGRIAEKRHGSVHFSEASFEQMRRKQEGCHLFVG